MTIAVAQTVFASDANFSTSGTTTVATVTTAAGSYIHLGITHDIASSQTVSTVISVPALTWTAGNVVNDASNAQAIDDYASSITAATTYVITVTFSGTATVKGTIAKEITGSSGFDTGSKAGQLQATPTTGTDATTTGNTPVLSAALALISSFAMDTQGNGGPAVGTGFTDGGTGWGFGGAALARSEHKRLTSSAASAATYTAAQNSSHATAAMVFLETPAGGGSGPTITQQPTNQSANSGVAATFTVVAQASGGALSYQWQDNRTGAFTNVTGGSGATTASYTTAVSDQTFQGRLYNCAVTDGNGTVTTNAASLGVVGFPVYLWDTTIPVGDDIFLRDPTQAGSSSGTAALTGVVGTGSVGTLTPTLTLALTGVSGTGSVGTVAPALSLALTGNTGTGSVGTVTPNNSVPLTAVASTGSVGAVVPTLSLGLTAVTGTGSVGTVLPATVVPLTGVTGTGSVGTVSASGAGTAALTGVTGTGSVGTLGPATDKALSAVSGTGSVGTVVPALSLTLGALSATGSAGTLSPSTVIALTGVSATGSVGTVTVQSGDVTIALTGVSALGSVGTLTPSGGDVSQGVGGGGSSRRKHRYIVNHGDQLLVFTDKQSAIQVLTQQASPPKKKKALPKPAETVSLPVIKEMAESRGQTEQFNTDLDSKRYEALVALFEQMRDEEEIELLLLHDH